MLKRDLPAVALATLLMLPLAAPAARSQEAADVADAVDAAVGAVGMARSGRVDEALAMVEAALASNPDDADALLSRGVILAESGRREEAERVFRGLIERHPGLPEAYNNLAVIQAAGGEFDAAVSTLKSALATDPSYQTAYENLTRIFAQLASEAYSRALEVESPPARAEVELAMLDHLSAPPAGVPASPRIADRPAPAEPMPPPAADPPAALAEEPLPAASGRPAADEEEAVVAGEEAAAGGEVESEDLAIDEMSSAPSETDLATVVNDWAQAWSDQRVDDYLAFYSEDFVPDNGMSRSDWEATRRQRLGAPEYIRVEVAILDSVDEGDDRAKVTFLQAYESDTYRDQVTKTLTLVRDGAAWKILEEKSGS